MAIPHNPEQLIAIVDENDNAIGKDSRKKIHADVKLHRETFVLIVNERNEILIQERADNGKLDFSAAGHFSCDEDYLDGAVREVEEELRLIVLKSKFKEIFKQRMDHSGPHAVKRFATLFEVKGNYSIKDMCVDSTEVKFIRYYSIDQLMKIMKSNPEKMTHGLRESLEIYLKKNKKT
jgi:isopentenyldiphosphate isomerase